MTINASLLREHYTLADMAYLDGPEAAPMYREQARIITDSEYKKIVDVGCRVASVRDHMDQSFPRIYMGFDTSPPAIARAEDNTSFWMPDEFYVASWNDPPKATFTTADVVVFGAVLIYANDPWGLFERLMDFYKADAAIIQEPMAENTEDFAYINWYGMDPKYTIQKSVEMTLDIPCPKRKIVHVTR